MGTQRGLTEDEEAELAELKDVIAFQLDMTELYWLAGMVFEGLEDAGPRVVEKLLETGP